MRLLTNTEISHVSGAKLDLGDGFYMEVSSVGIPAHAYLFIDSLFNQVINDTVSTEDAVVKLMNAGYWGYFEIYNFHLENNHFTISFSA